jgi:hypothetical protein
VPNVFDVSVAIIISVPHAIVSLTGRGRASNQFDEKSKKQWSAQLHELAKSTNSRKLQYTHGRFRKYVQTKNKNMKSGEAFVGMKSRGSQLRNYQYALIYNLKHQDDIGAMTYLLRQNMA